MLEYAFNHGSFLCKSDVLSLVNRTATRTADRDSQIDYENSVHDTDMLESERLVADRNLVSEIRVTYVWQEDRFLHLELERQN